MDIEKSFSRVQRSDTVSRVFGYLRGETEVLPMVFDGNKCYGFVDEKLFISTRLHTNQQIKGFDVRVRVMNESNSTDEIVKEMLRSYCPYAPFGKSEKDIEGYIKACTVIRALFKENRINKSAEVIARPITLLKKDDNLGKAINLLRNFRAVPIIDNDGKLYGCIEQRGNLIDLLADRERSRQGAYVSTNDVSVFNREVINYATKFVPSCEAKSAIDENMISLLELNGYCFVHRDNKPVGIITTLDLLKVIS
jgi:predicted transcriptional regulator